MKPVTTQLIKLLCLITAINAIAYTVHMEGIQPLASGIGGLCIVVFVVID